MKKMIEIRNGARKALIVPSALAAWQLRGWELVGIDSEPAPEPIPQAPPEPRETPPVRDDSAETLESDSPATVTSEESS